MEKDLEGTVHGIIRVISWNLSGRTEENQSKFNLGDLASHSRF
jgi:hypothetical protein